MYENEQPRGPKDHVTEFAKGAGLAAAGFVGAAYVPYAGLSPLWQWLAAAGCAATGIGGLFYAVGIAAEWFLPRYFGWRSYENGREQDTAIAENITQPNGHATRPDQLLDQLRIRIERRVPWFERVNWEGLAKYVATEPDPEFTREALLPWVPARVYSRYNPSDMARTFPEMMCHKDLGIAREIETNNYQWTSRGKRIMREIYNESLSGSPSPTSVTHEN